MDNIVAMLCIYLGARAIEFIIQKNLRFIFKKKAQDCYAEKIDLDQLFLGTSLRKVGDVVNNNNNITKEVAMKDFENSVSSTNFQKPSANNEKIIKKVNRKNNINSNANNKIKTNLKNPQEEHNFSKAFLTKQEQIPVICDKLFIKQQMMINSLSEFSDSYGYTRASMQQESSWKVMGEMAETYLPILLSLIKSLVYVNFIFIAPMMLMAGGFKKYLNYLTVVISLQLWPVLCVVLNLFIDLYSSTQLSDIAGNVISFATFSRIGNYADKIVGIASALQLCIPFLVYSIPKGGIEGVANIAGNISNGMQSVSSSAASEVVTGNRSLDNVSIGNRQFAMQSGLRLILIHTFIGRFN